MRVIIVDKSAPGFVRLGRMEAQPGMITTAGNEIKSVNGESCRVTIGGKLLRKTEVCIDLAEALKFGWAQNGHDAVQQLPAHAAIKRNAEASATPHKSATTCTPKRNAAFWEQQADEKIRLTNADLRPFDKKLNKSNLQEYDYRITRGLENRQWAATMRVIARLINESQLPQVLCGLTNAQQVRQLMRWNEKDKWSREPRNMGPTIKTPAQLKEAAREVKAIMPALESDPNPDPRAGTKYDKGRLA